MRVTHRTPLFGIVSRLVMTAMIATNIDTMPISAQARQATESGERTNPAGSAFIELALKDGRQISGRIVNVEAGAVTLADAKITAGQLITEPGRRVTVQQTDISRAKLLTPFTARDEASDAATARYVITLLGANKKIELKTAGQRLRTVIRSIEPDGVTVQKGRHATERIAYGDIRQVGSSEMRTGVKAAIIAAVAFGAFLGISLLNFLTCQCS